MIIKSRERAPFFLFKIQYYIDKIFKFALQLFLTKLF